MREYENITFEFQNKEKKEEISNPGTQENDQEASE